MQNTLPVTLGEELCKTHSQLLMGRNYAKLTLHKSCIICKQPLLYLHGKGLCMSLKEYTSNYFLVIDYESHQYLQV